MNAPETFNAWTLFTRSLRVTFGTLLNTLGLLFIFGILPVGLWIAWVATTGDDVPEEVLGISCLLVAVLLVGTAPLLMAGISYSAFHYLRGRKISLGRCLRETLPCYFKVLVTLLSVGFLGFAGYMLCIVPGIIIIVGLYLAVPIATVERLSMPMALKRSWALTEGYRLSLFLFLLLMSVINYVFVIPMSLLESVEGGEVATGALAVVALPVMLLVSLVSIVSYGVAYFDLRHLQEGDLDENVVDVFE